MAIVYSSDLASANSSAMINNIDEIISTSDELNNQINEFVSESSSNLSGKVFEIIKNNFSLYSDALMKQKQIYINLKSNILAANNEMINYMEGYEKIDDSKKEEIRELLNRIHANIEYLESQSKEEKPALKGDINALYSTYNEMNKYYKKIEGLAQQDNSAFSKLSDVITDISNYSKALGITRSGYNGTFTNIGNRKVIYYSQTGHYVNGKLVKWNSNWKDIKDSGCGPTSYAMVIATMKGDPSITPETIANLMAENNWSNEGGGFIYKVSEKYGVNCVNGRFSGNAIEEVIKNGGGFIGSAREGGHYIAVTDVVYKDNQRYFVLCDPYPPFNGNRSEPVLVTEEELRNQKISMDFYIAPKNVEIIKEQEGGKIVSIRNTSNNETVQL